MLDEDVESGQVDALQVQANETNGASQNVQNPRSDRQQGENKNRRTLGERLNLVKTLQQTASILLKDSALERAGPLAELVKHLQEAAFELLAAEKSKKVEQRQEHARSDKGNDPDMQMDGLLAYSEKEQQVLQREPPLSEEEANRQEVDPEPEPEDEEYEEQEENMECSQENRSQMKCATWNCNYRVHSKSIFGSYCCISCYESGGLFGHGHNCERIEFTKKDEESKQEDAKKVEDGTDVCVPIDAPKELVEKLPVPELSKEEIEANNILEEAKQLAKKMKENAKILLRREDLKSTSKEAADGAGEECCGNSLRQEDKLALAKKLQDTSSLLLKDGVIDKVGHVAKKLQDFAFVLLKDDVKAEQEDALKKDPQNLKHADSVLKEATRKNPEEWRQDIAKYRRARDVDMLIKTLQDGSEALLKDGIALEEAMKWAKEAETQYRKIGSRWRLGVVLDIIARLHLKQLDALLVEAEAGGHSTRAARELHLKEATRIATEAVTLLKKIGHSREEESLASARATLSEARAKADADENIETAKPKAKSRAKSTPTDDAQTWKDAVSEKRRLYRMAPDGRGDHAGFARTLEQGAEALLKAGKAEEALILADECSMLYRKIGAARELGIALNIVSKASIRRLLDALESAGVSDVALLRDRQHLLKAKTASTESVALLRKGVTLEWLVPLVASQCTLIRVRGFEQRSSQFEENSTDISLEKTFGYAVGIEKPASFGKFDIRDDVCKTFGGFVHGQVVRDQDRNKFVVIGVRMGFDDSTQKQLWFQPKSINRPASVCFTGLHASDLAKLFLPVSMGDVNEVKAEDLDADEDSDGEPITLCHECLLPLGRTKYASKDGEGLLHGECIAKNLLYNSKAEDEKWRSEEARKKTRDRVEYNIGWRPDRMIPRNVDFLRERRVPIPPGATEDSLFCLMLDGGSNPKVRLVPTKDPECSLVLEYLVIALQVRIKANMSPYFSLDTPKADEPWQIKTFGPPWLKGTSAGEVLFQADYHLKELSMGDSLFEQPVAGMRSCWDYEWAEAGWRGREWFVVKDAKVTLSETGVLVPYVKMGVEAREQVVNEKRQLVDARVTSKDHPLVQYADVFTHYFDLIAERKSVIFYLRELSRAAIVAKFLLDNKIALDDWLLKGIDKTDVCKMDLPFNKQERTTYEILVCDGAIKEVQGGVQQSMTGLYGGVDLNIDAFDLTMPMRLSRSVQAPNYAAIYADPDVSGGSSKELGKLTQRELKKLIEEAGGEAPHGPSEKDELIQQLTSLRPAVHGVQTNETTADDEETLPFLPDLEEDIRGILRTEDSVRAVMDAIRTRAKLGKSENLPEEQKCFWESLNGDSEKSRTLKNVFSCRFCDRRGEKHLFVPPAVGGRYLKSLQDLIDEERSVREKRRLHFMSVDFVASAPGELFPSSWKSSFRLRTGRGFSVAAGGDKQGRKLVECKMDASPIIAESRPLFDKCTPEDGMRFRIYRRGAIEVRTTQDGEDGEEKIGATFQVESGTAPPPDGLPIMKVTLFANALQSILCGEEQKAPIRPYSYFVVFETDLGDMLVLQKLSDDKVVLEENPGDFDDRYAQAVVLSAGDCSASATTVRDVREYFEQVKDGSTSLSGRCLAQDAFEWAGSTPIVSVCLGGVLQVPGMHTRGEAPPPAPVPVRPPPVSKARPSVQGLVPSRPGRPPWNFPTRR